MAFNPYWVRFEIVLIAAYFQVTARPTRYSAEDGPRQDLQIIVY
jgi:hypothetical protein